MRTNTIILFSLILFSQEIFSQRNPYFQQKVDYKIDIFLNPKEHRLTGTQVAVYYNNSPDTLREIYYHLYLNAFRPGSSMQIRGDVIKNRLGERIRAMKPDEYGWTEVKSLTADGEKIEFEIFDTILKAKLKKPLPPSASVRLEMKFESQIPKQTRRNGRDNREGIDYSMAQWYPKICEYDFEGWHPNQYIEREFYGVWGNFDVKITLPSDYLVGATGKIQNPDEVLCGYELGAVDTVIFPQQWKKQVKSEFKTWHFKAENVHDFAWVADRDYIHEITWFKLHGDTVLIHLLYQPDVYHLWRETGKFTKEILKIYSDWLYKYPYSTFTVAQAGDGGMEYPTLIMITGRRSRTSMIGILAHEIGHNWFYGLIGNNESKEAWIDEGGASFLTQRVMKHFLGERWNQTKGFEKFFIPDSDIFGGYRNYIRFSPLGYEEPVLLHSDFFRESVSYTNAVYGKGASVFEMLEYVVGDSVFEEIMKEFFNRWAFKHPTTKDFETLAEKISGMELDWFFDQWLKTTRRCDYGIEKFDLKFEPTSKKYSLYVKLKNYDQIVMPIDIVIKFDDGSQQKVIIPLDLQLVPKNEQNAIILPFWFWVNPVYEFTLEFDKKPVGAEIDPSLRLRDINRLNNTARLGEKIQISFLKQWQFNPPLDKYWLSMRPSLWYSELNGVRVGLVFNSAYLFDLKRTEIDLWFNSKNKNVDFLINFSNQTSILGRLSKFEIEALKIHGLRRFAFEISKNVKPLYISLPPDIKISFFFEHTFAPETKFQFANLTWEGGRINSVGTKIDYAYYFSERSNLNAKFKFKTTTSNSVTNFTNLSLEILQSVGIGFLDLMFRLFAFKTYGRPPEQEIFRLTANSYEMFFNKQFRMIYLLSEKFSGESKLFLSGGLNMRGFSEFSNVKILDRGLSSNFDISLLKTTMPFGKLQVNTFADCGIFKTAEGDSTLSLKSPIFDYGFEISIQPFTFIPVYADNILNNFRNLAVTVVFPLGIYSNFERIKVKNNFAIEIRVVF